MDRKISKGKFKLQIFWDLDCASSKAAEMFLNLSEQYIEHKRRFAVALSGGSTPKRLYEILGSEPFNNTVDWSNIHFFWADERCVPPEHEDSNFRIAFETFLSKIPLHDRHIHRIKCEGEPDKAVKEYENDLRSFFDDAFLHRFGLIFLGIGKDGHTASLLPESHVLKEKHRLVAYVKNKKTEYPRITLTLPVINNAENIIFLVGGKDKAPMVKRVIEERDPSLPASLVDPVKGNLFFLLDKGAGFLLNKECDEVPVGCVKEDLG